MKSDEDSRVSTEEHIWQSSFNMAQEDVTHMAMGVMALLRNDKKKALQQVKQLIKLKKEMACAVLTSDVGGWTPVHACVLRGHKKLLKTMLKAGIPVNSTMGQPEGLPARCTLLHVAANRTDKKILDYLLHHGADVNARDSDGNTALFYARQSNKDNARLLINCGATLDDSYGSKLSQNQSQNHHFSVTKPPRQRHGSSSSLRQEKTLPIPKSNTCHQLQPSHQNGQSNDSMLLTVSTLETPSSTKSQFLTVPPTKFFSSSPCLHVQGATGSGNSQSFINSSSSANNLRSPDQRSNKKFKNTPSIIINNNNNNNNSTTVTDLNSKRGLKHASRSGYASSESILDKSGFQRVQNNSD